MQENQEHLERQYRDGRLQYRQSVPRLRRWLRPYLNDRITVARQLVEELCRTPAPRRVLDFGCGDGDLVYGIANAVPHGVAEIIGVDRVEARIRRAQARLHDARPGGPRVRFIVGDETTVIQLREGGFDVITAIATISQVRDMYGVARHLRDAIVPGGYLVVEFANYAYFRRRLQLLFGQVPTISPAPMELWPEIGWDSGMHGYANRKMCLQFLAQTGFDAQSVRSTGLVANAVRIWPSLFATGFVIAARRCG